MSYKHIPFGTVEKFNVVVEVPIGSHNKYEYDEELDAITLDYVFREEFNWPFNYGYIPQTQGGDGDHLDVYILTPYPLEVGTVVVARPIGMIELLDRGEEDNKILSVPVHDEINQGYQSVDDLPNSMIKELRVFLENIGREKHKSMEIVAFHGKERAIKELEDCRVDK